MATRQRSIAFDVDANSSGSQAAHQNSNSHSNSADSQEFEIALQNLSGSQAEPRNSPGSAHDSDDVLEGPPNSSPLQTARFANFYRSIGSFLLVLVYFWIDEAYPYNWPWRRGQFWTVVKHNIYYTCT